MNQYQALATENDSLISHPPDATSPPRHSGNNPQPGPQGYGSIETPNVPQSYSWYEDYQRNKPQYYSLCPAIIIFMTGGMDLTASVGFATIDAYGTHAQYCWFIAVIIGACLSALLARKITKFTFDLSASVLVIVNGIIYIVSEPNTPWTVFARYVNGIAFGLTLIKTILAGSEQSVKNIRGLVLCAEQISIFAGAMWVIPSTVYIMNDDEKINQETHGILAVIYGVFAFVLAFLFAIDSPIFHLLQNNETEAVNAARQLQNPPWIASNDTMDIVNESKALLDEDLARGRSENISNSWIPLLKISMLRALVSLSFSLPINWAFIWATSENVRGSVPLLNTCILMRLFGVVCSYFTLDRIGRRKPCAISLLIGSVLLVVVGLLFSDSLDMSKECLRTIITLLLLYQMLSGFVAPASTCYLGEAFSVSVKPYFILISIIVENIIQIVVCTQSTFESTSNFIYTLAALQFAFAFIFYFTFPETKRKTLREALEMFKKTVYINF